MMYELSRSNQTREIVTARGSEWHECTKLKENISILRLCNIGPVVYLSLRSFQSL
jgi:hypothetical protein